MKELVEHIFVKPVLEENSGALTFTAIVSEGDYINANHRMYPTDILWAAFQQTNEDLASYPGTVDHPDPWSGTSVQDNGVKWLGFYREADTPNIIRGRGTIIPTAKGKDLEANIAAGIKIGFSTRTRALTEERVIDGKVIDVITAMEPPFVDAVADPSVAHARVQSVTREEKAKMDEKLLAIAEAKGRAEAELELRKSEEQRNELEQKNARATELLAECEATISRLERELVEANAKLEAVQAAEATLALDGKIAELTRGHRFEATIAARVRRLPGLSLETVEGFVSEITELVEALASAGNEGYPRGTFENTQDNPDPVIAAENKDEDEADPDLVEARLV